MELLFRSFTTLSSTGLSDVAPISGHARSVVVLELVSQQSQRSAARAANTEPGPDDRPHPR